MSPDERKLDLETVLNFGTAKDGSWWVYLKENTDLKDSVYLTGYDRRTEFFDGGGCFYTEIITYNLNGQNVFCGSVAARIDARTSIEVIRIMDTTLSDTRLFSFSFQKERGIGYQDEQDFDYEFIPSYTLLGITYSNVIKLTFKKRFSNGSIGVAFNRYFAPLIGQIRCEDHLNNEVYNLSEYVIVQ